MQSFPASNLQGTYEGSCIACLRGTDTGLAFQGEAEWVIAGLIMLGVEDDVAPLIISQAFGLQPDMVPGGVVTVPLRVCETCAEAAGLQVALVALGELPVYGQPPS